MRILKFPRNVKTQYFITMVPESMWTWQRILFARIHTEQNWPYSFRKQRENSVFLLQCEPIFSLIYFVVNIALISSWYTHDISWILPNALNRLWMLTTRFKLPSNDWLDIAYPESWKLYLWEKNTIFHETFGKPILFRMGMAFCLKVTIVAFNTLEGGVALISLGKYNSATNSDNPNFWLKI